MGRRSTLYYHQLTVVNQSTPLCPVGIEVMSCRWRGWNGLTCGQELQFENSPVLFIKTFYYRWIVGKHLEQSAPVFHGIEVVLCSFYSFMRLDNSISERVSTVLEIRCG
jgi:hypothetical protein